MQYVNQSTPDIANAVLMLLCNLTREKHHANTLFELLKDQTAALDSLLKLFITRDVENETNYDYISYLLSNLCQLHQVRM